MRVPPLMALVLRLTALATIAGLIVGCAYPSAPADRYAILIGATRYSVLSFNTLTYPDQDAKALQSLLQKTGWTDVQMVNNENATAAGIKATIMALASRVSSTSSVLVYYSGHGVSINGVAYIAPYDTAADYLINTNSMISMADISSWMRTVPCKNQMLILDSCYSGGFVDRAASADTAPQNYGPLDGGTETSFLSAIASGAVGLLSRALTVGGDPAILTISAAGSLEQSYDDGDHGHGAFSYYLIQAGTDAAADGDGNKLVTAMEAYSYAKNMIKLNWNAKYWNLYDNGMYMDFLPHISGGSGDIVLYDKR